MIPRQMDGEAMYGVKEKKSYEMTATVATHKEVHFTYCSFPLHWPPQPGSGSSLPSSSGRTLCCQQAWHWGSGGRRAGPAIENVRR